uniref:Uncharacterized protein n=1 Tax=Anguilla anguilla TaxID=7936 RepID=A0A0E9S9N7_ANGAN
MDIYCITGGSTVHLRC